MERFTQHNDSLCTNCEWIGSCRVDCEKQKIYARLAELEDKLESGRMVEFPCKVGDTVWYIEYNYCSPNLSSRLKAKPIIVTEISWKCDRSGKDLGFALIANGTRYKISSIGKTVFLTKEAAEARIKGLKQIRRINHD